MTKQLVLITKSNVSDDNIRTYITIVLEPVHENILTHIIRYRHEIKIIHIIVRSYQILITNNFVK